MLSVTLGPLGASAVALVILSTPYNSAQAGSDMLAAPLSARLELSRVHARVGQTVTVSLHVVPTTDIADLDFDIKAGACAQEMHAASPSHVKNAKAGQRIEVRSWFKVVNTTPCDFIAQAVNFDDQKNRFGSVFSATLNPARQSTTVPAKSGVTARGEKTIEAPAAKQ